MTESLCFHEPLPLNKNAYNAVIVKVPIMGANGVVGDKHVAELSKLGKASGKQPQRMFCSALNWNAFHNFLNDRSNPLAARYY